MRVDWSTAEVALTGDSGEFRLSVRLRDIRGNAYYDAFDAEAAKWQRSVGDERRNIDRYMTGGTEWGIYVWPIDPDDVDAERRLLDEFVERVNRRAAPEQAKLEKADRQKRAEREARERQAKDLTERFRQS